MTKLSVNVNKLATLRNARGGNNPDLVATTKKIIEFGAQGITVHPRPDERHIRLTDVFELSKLVSDENQHRQEKLEFNIEGYPSNEFMNLIAEVRPDQCTLVPDPPDVITSNAGWLCSKNKSLLADVLKKLRDLNVRSSLFIDPYTLDTTELEALKELKPDCCELYTEKFASDFGTARENQTLQKYLAAATQIKNLKIGLNAGHDLDQRNIKTLVKTIPFIDELSIGHALVCESLFDGLELTINNYLKEISSGSKG